MEKPCGVIITPTLQRETPGARQLMSEQARLENDQDMIRELKAASRDQIGEQFGGKYYKTHFLFWERMYLGRPLEVSRYYPDRAVAIDTFKVIGEEELKEIEFKRTYFQRIDIRYAALSWSSDLSEVVAQIGLKG